MLQDILTNLLKLHFWFTVLQDMLSNLLEVHLSFTVSHHIILVSPNTSSSLCYMCHYWSRSRSLQPKQTNTQTKTTTKHQRKKQTNKQVNATHSNYSSVRANICPSRNIIFCFHHGSSQTALSHLRTQPKLKETQLESTQTFLSNFDPPE